MFGVCGFSGGGVPVLAVVAVEVEKLATSSAHAAQDELVT